MSTKSSQTAIPLALLRSVTVVTVTIAAGISCGTTADVAGAQSTDLSAQLGATVRTYVASWNTHDPSALAEFFTADADMIMGNGPIREGRAAIEGWWRDYFSVQEPERTLTIDTRSIRSATADVALLNVVTTTGGRTIQGVELIPRKARGTWVLVRQDGNWLISAMRGMPTQQDRIIRGGG